jgi:hypothetical protein
MKLQSAHASSRRQWLADDAAAFQDVDPVPGPRGPPHDTPARRGALDPTLLSDLLGPLRSELSTRVHIDVAGSISSISNSNFEYTRRKCHILSFM